MLQIHPLGAIRGYAEQLVVKKQQTDWLDEEFRESYMLSYMLDTEMRDSLLNLKWFENPFNMTLKNHQEQ
jgi:adenine-specific DNA-methyltransferase